MTAALAHTPDHVTIAGMLGLQVPQMVTKVRLAEAVQRGITVPTLARVAKLIDPDHRLFEPTNIVPRSTLARLKTARGHISSEATDRLVGLLRVYVAAVRAYGGDAEAARDFLDRSHAMLDGKRPIDVATASITGADAVLDIIAAAEAGVAV